MGQPVAFFEVLSPDAPRAQQFYADLFDWAIAADPSMGGFGLVDTRAGDGAIPGGIGPVIEGGHPGVTFYVRVGDLAAALDRAEQLGGKRVLPPTELPNDYGTIAMFTDLDGNTVGLWA